jgi:Ca-activated chloride channel family protein
MRSIIAALACAFLLSSAAVAQQGGHLTAPPLMQVEPGERPVELESAQVSVEPMAGLARTTLELVFRNPNARVLEGNLQFPLRPGQQVVGFALDVDGRMREAVPVEKAQGRRVFEAIEREGIDPGLLEQTAGEFFRLRVYPFGPGATRRVRITLVEPLARHAGGHAVTVPLAFAHGLARVDVDVVGSMPPAVEGTLRPLQAVRVKRGLHRVSVGRADLRGDGALTLVVPAAATPAVQVQTHGDARYFLAEVPIGDTTAPRALPARMGLLWDSSMSGARRAHDLEYALLERYFRAAGDIEVDLVRLRDVAGPAQRFTVRGGDWSKLRAALEATVYDGATNAGGWTPDAAVGDYLLFGDGLFNYGARPFPALREGQRLYAVMAGVAGDRTRLASLADRHGGMLIALDDAAGLEGAASRLLHDGVRLQSVDAIGAVDVRSESPHVVDGVLRVAGRITATTPRISLRLAGPGGVRTVDVATGDAIEGGMAAWAWARYELARLQADPARNRAAIAELGREFNLVTPQTSLIVLERVEDYVRHDIAPPPELRAQVAALVRERDTSRAKERGDRIERITEQWRERIEWWETAFPKGRPLRPKYAKEAAAGADAVAMAVAAADAAASSQRERASVLPRRALAAAPPPAPPAPAEASTSLDRVQVTGSRIVPGDLDAGEGAATIVLRPWQPDSPVARRLRLADADEVYALYLDERQAQAGSTAFFLDVADVLFDAKREALALRVLSNLAELQLEDRHVLRVLAHRLLQAGRPELALPLFERVLEIGEEEPQSYRDLALAHAALGHTQKAVDLLHEVVTGDWDRRFTDIEMTALAELNALVATSDQPLDTSRVHAPLLRNLPLELRAVLTWDSDNSDMDLWVTDPNGEKAYYSNRLTYQGGRMSDDFTGGYGPEEFALRDAKPGRYKVEANFFGDRQQLVTGATTLQLWLSTGFGTGAQRDRTVTLRLKEKAETVFVGEFEVE